MVNSGYFTLHTVSGVIITLLITGVWAHLVPSTMDRSSWQKCTKKRVETKGFYTFPLQTTRRNPQNDGALKSWLCCLNMAILSFYYFWYLYSPNFWGNCYKPTHFGLPSSSDPSIKKTTPRSGPCHPFPFLVPWAVTTFPWNEGRKQTTIPRIQNLPDRRGLRGPIPSEKNRNVGRVVPFDLDIPGFLGNLPE